MAKFEVKKAVREKIFPKIALIAPSGGGKTYSALRLATGMAEEIKELTGKEAPILLANTEQKRGYYYADEFSYDIVDVEAPHEPEKYVDLINFAIESNYSILIIDSSSHEWEGKGGCLELQQRAGGTYQAWAKVTPRHSRYISAIADSPLIIIATMRAKDQYEVGKDEKGKVTVQKIGAGAKQRDGFEYEFTCTFMLDVKTNTAEVEKDNTHLFESAGPKLLTEEDGKRIIKWANSGTTYTPPKRVIEPSEVEMEDQLASIKKEIITLCTELGGTKNEQLMETLKKFTKSGNPNAIHEVSAATECLAAIKGVKPLAV